MKVKNSAALKAVLDRQGIEVDDDGNVKAKPAAAPVQSNAEVLAAVKGIGVGIEARDRAIVEAVKAMAKMETPVGQKIEGLKIERDEDGFMSYLRFVYAKAN